MYIDSSLRTYLDDLAAKKPAPGGGSAAALAAATGVALMSMVANYTVGKEKYKNVETEMAELLVKCDRARAELQSLIDKDVEAYHSLSKAMKEKLEGPALEALYKKAADVPLEICRIASESLKLCGELAAKGNPNLVTDTAIAAIMLEGAFFSAKYNVYSNLHCIDDMDYIGTVHSFLAPLEESMPLLKEEILEKCEEQIEK